MANPYVGEIEINAGGKAYSLRLSMRAIITIEKKFAKGISKVIAENFADGTNISGGDIVSIFWAAMQHHSVKPTEEQVIDICDELGLLKCSKVLSELMQLNFGGEPGEGDAPGNPQAAAT